MSGCAEKGEEDKEEVFVHLRKCSSMLKEDKHISEFSPLFRTSVPVKKKSLFVEEGEGDKEEKADKRVRIESSCWRVGDKVCVCLTDVPGFERYQYCHMDGVVAAVDGETVNVSLINGQSVTVIDSDCLSHVREAEMGVVWNKGDKVHVHEDDGWWEATIKSACKGGKWKVEWAGQYQDYGNVAIVEGDSLRQCHNSLASLFKQ